MDISDPKTFFAILAIGFILTFSLSDSKNISYQSDSDCEWDARNGGCN